MNSTSSYSHCELKSLTINRHLDRGEAHGSLPREILSLPGLDYLNTLQLATLHNHPRVHSHLRDLTLIHWPPVHQTVALFTEVEFDILIAPGIYPSIDSCCLRDRHLVVRVVSPYNAVAEADGALALIERSCWFRQDDSDGVAVTSGVHGVGRIVEMQGEQEGESWAFLPLVAGLLYGCSAHRAVLYLSKGSQVASKPVTLRRIYVEQAR
jgi:hypothetical protein